MSTPTSNVQPAPSKKNPSPSIGDPESVSGRPHIEPATLRRLNGGFIENRGQFRSPVQFRLAGAGPTLWVTDQGLVFDALRADTHEDRASRTDRRSESPLQSRFSFGMGSGVRATNLNKYERLVFSEDFVGASAAPDFEASGCQPGSYNYFIGNDPKKWVTHVSAYSEIIHRNVWPGIDLRLYRNGQDIEQEFVVKPGGDVSAIRVNYKGIEGLKVADDGALVVMTAFGELRESKPRIYQEVAGKRKAVEGRFKLTSATSYAFEVVHRNAQYALVIDPSLLYSTFLGGSGSDAGNAIAVDSAGNSYVTGTTASTNFPTTSGVVQSSDPAPGNSVAFVTKLNPLGSQPVYSTYLGSTTGGDVSRGIAVDSSGEAYVTGTGYPGYPTTSNAYAAACNGTFMTKLSADGSALVYSSCFGTDVSPGGGYGVAVDTAAKAYVTGTTYGGCCGGGGPFPTTPNAFQSNPAGGLDAFLAVIDTTQSGATSLVYSTYLGGNQFFGQTGGFNVGVDSGNAVAVDAYGMAYVTGSTASSNFPVTAGAYQSTFAGPTQGPILGGGGFSWATNAFVAKFNPAASGTASLIYSTYLGGSEGASATSIAVDALGNAYVTGSTEGYGFVSCGSTGCTPLLLPFPTTAGAFQAPDLGFSSGFVTKLNAAGNGLVYSTMLESPTNFGSSGASAIAIDSQGEAFVTGSTRAPNFPQTAGAFEPCGNGAFVGPYLPFVTKFNSAGSGVLYSGCFGGGNGDSINGIASDLAGDAYVTGQTKSSNFPVTGPFAFQQVYGGNGDAFVTKFPLGAPQGISILGMTPTAGGNAGTATSEIVGGGFHAGATAQFTCGGSTINGSNLSVGTQGRIITTTFNLTSATPGTCDLVVTNPDGTNATLPAAFTIQQGGAPNAQIYKVGTPAIENLDTGVITPVTYYITVQNTGNVDATNGFVSEILDSEFTLTSVNPQAAAGPATLAADSFVLWSAPIVAPGGSTVFTYTTTIALSTPLGATLVGGPGCFLTGLDISVLSACIVQASASNPNCLVLDTALGLAAGYCTACVLGLPVGENCAECIAALVNCYKANKIAPCPQFPVCLQQAAKACTSFTQQLIKAALDPNYLVGSTGVGGQHWISGGQVLPYLIGFSNDWSAGAPAQQVVVTQPLDPSMNLSTLSLSGITIPNGTSGQISVPVGSFNPVAGLDEFTANVDLRPAQNLFVLVDAKLNPSTSTITWTFTSIDPATGLPPTNPLVGFLAPGTTASVFFSVNPMQGVATGTQISDQASVVFSGVTGTNPLMSTSVWVNTVDNTPPTSSVSPLPTDETTPTFTVQWSGTDVGSGIATFNIYVSVDGGPFTVWQQNTSATSAGYTGAVGHSYAFYSIATDLVGNIEPPKTAAEATTMVTLPSSTVTFTGAPTSAAYGTTFTVTTTTNASTTAVITASGACTILGNTVTMTSGTGTCTLTANWAADANYPAATATQTTTATFATATVTFTGAPLTAVYGSTFSVASTTNASSAAVITASGACSILGNTVTMTSGTGTCTLTANWAADNDYAAATASQTVTAALATATANFTGAPPSAVYGSTFTVGATTNASTAAVISASGACSILGNTVTMTSGTGACSLTANWAADNNYSAASLNQITTATKATPTVTFTGAPASATYGSTFSVASTTIASTMAAVTATGSCSILGNAVTMTSGIGTCALTANWAADANYLSATSSQTVTATLAIATVTFTGAPASAVYGSSFAVSATTNAGTTATLTASGACSILGNTVTMTTGTGICSLSADWSANSDYASAILNQTTTAAKATPTITFTGAPATAVYDSSFAVSAATNASTVAAITAAGSCSITGNTVTITSGTGTCSLAANWSADNNYNAATAGQSATALKAGSGVAITSTSPNPSALGQAVAVNFQVSGITPPTGTVTVAASTGESCAGGLSGGVGSCSITFSTAGSRTLTATYSGDANFNGSSSAAFSQSVLGGPVATISPLSLDFGDVYLRTREARKVTLTNTGNGALTVTGLRISGGNDSDDFRVEHTCRENLLPSKSCEIVVTFVADRDNYNPTGTLAIMDNAGGSPQIVALSATVINPRASLSSDVLDFARQEMNTTSAPKTVTLTNTGTTPLVLSTVTITGDFALGSGTTCADGATLGRDESCVIAVTFNPRDRGRTEGKVTIHDNTRSREQVIALDGIGD